MSMWDIFDDEEPDPYPRNDHNHQQRDPHSRSSDDDGGYGDQQSHSGHNHHRVYGHDEHHGHGYGHVEHDESNSYHGHSSEASPSRQNYGSHHESYAGHRHHQGHGYHHGHESYARPSYSPDNTESTHHGGHQSYGTRVGYGIPQEHQASPPPPAGHGHEISSRDLFTSDSVVNLSFHEIDALARVRRSRSWLVVLYAPWCHFCQAMEPNFERVAQRLEHSNVYVGRFRADGDYKDYAKRYLQLQHFPTVLFFPRNSSNIVKYQSENREVDAILGFVRAFE